MQPKIGRWLRNTIALLNWYKALANFKKAVAQVRPDPVSARRQSGHSWNDHRVIGANSKTNMALRAKHPESLHFRLDLRPARWRGGRRPVETSCDARQEP